MRRAIRAIGWLFVACALLAAIAYAVALAFAGDRSDFTQQWASGLALALVAGVIGLLAQLLPGVSTAPSVKLPPGWLSIGLFALAVGAGYATTLTGWAVYLAPVFAVIAATALGTAVYRFSTYWAANRELSRGLVFPALLWSMVGAPLLAGILQLALAAAIIGAIAAGLYIHDPSLATESEIRSIFDDLGESRGATVPDLYSTPTVALALFTLLAFVAPFTEELLKGLGVLVTFRKRRAFSERDVFVAGIGAGLGFAAVEALGYSLLDIDFWPTMMLLRAPVVVIHIAATLLFARGWYLQRTQGGVAIGRYYGAAVLLHGIWNGLFVATLVLMSNVGDASDPDPVTASLILAVVGALGLTWLVAVGIVVAGARRFSGEDGDAPALDSVDDRASRASSTATSAGLMRPHHAEPHH